MFATDERCIILIYDFRLLCMIEDTGIFLARQGEERERNREGMAAADLESAFYRYYSKLQPAVMALNQQRLALKECSTRQAKSHQTHAPSSR